MASNNIYIGLVVISVVHLVVCLPQDYYDTDYKTQDEDYQVSYTPPVTPHIHVSQQQSADGLEINGTDGLEVPSNLAMEVRHQIEGARTRAMLNFMEKIIIALGPDFQKELPKGPSDDTVLPTLVTPINHKDDDDTCPDQFSRCSSQGYYPSCVLPSKTDQVVWDQNFNIYFNLSDNISKGPNTILNATLRLYKNYTIPLLNPIAVTVKLFSYSKSLTKRRDKTTLITTTEVLSNYTGWVWLDVGEFLQYLKPSNNHGFLITVHDALNYTWHGPSVFATMDCNSALRALPFELSSNTSTDRFPTLNIVTGYLKSPVNNNYEIEQDITGDNIPLIYKPIVKPIMQRKRPSKAHSRWQRINHDVLNDTIPVQKKIAKNEKKTSKIDLDDKYNVSLQQNNKKRQINKSLHLGQSDDKPIFVGQHKKVAFEEKLLKKNSNLSQPKTIDKLIINKNENILVESSTEKTVTKRDKHRSSSSTGQIDEGKHHHGHHHNRQSNKSKSRSRSNKKTNRRKNQRKQTELHNQ